MIVCKNCGVELEKSMNYCPLCGEPVNDELAEIQYIRIRKSSNEKQLTDFQKLNPDEKRKVFWAISAIILISGIMVTFIIDYLSAYSISWAKYPILICAILFINTSLISFLHQRIILFLSGSFLSTASLLVIIDVYNGNIGWGFKLGIPLLLAAYIIIFTLIMMIRKAVNKGLNIIAYTFIACGLLTICAEGIISLYTGKLFRIDWSIIVTASVLPVAAILLYIQYRLKKGTNLKRFFHL